jgi:hypothetical protein
LQILLKFLRFVLEKPCWVIIPVLVICPLFVNILISHELSHLLIAGIGVRLSEPFGQVFLPVRIDNLVGEILEKFYLSWRPFVKVHRFDLGDVYT